MGLFVSIAITAATCAAVSAAATGLLRSLLVRFAVVDAATERSSHVGTVPRGGGIAFVLVGLAAAAAIAARGAGPDDPSGEPLRFLALWVAALVVAIIGAVDDARSIGAAPRLAVHLVAGAALVWAASPLPAVQLPGGAAVDLAWAAWPLLMLATAWSINLTNFMDGIDGIAATHGAIVLAFIAACAAVHGDSDLALTGAALSGAVAGFLPWNLSRAGRIFMGDAGSGFLGFAIAACAVLAWHRGAITPWAALIAGSTFVTDATVTLLRRALLRQRLAQPHRTHAYQHLAQRAGSHHRVTALFAGADLAWALPLAAAAVAWPQWGIALAAVAYAPLALLALRLNAGQASGAETR